MIRLESVKELRRRRDRVALQIDEVRRRRGNAAAARVECTLATLDVLLDAIDQFALLPAPASRYH
jgi:hypothetical protein